jgi:RNA polymerase sigma-70 factor, ECF subfamily
MDQKEQIFMEITRNRSAIMAPIVAMVRDFNDAEDIFQETVREIIHHADRYEPDRAFLAWARGIARNMVKRFYAARKRAPTLLDEESLESLADVVAQEDVALDIWENEAAFLQSCLENIGHRNRRLFILRYEKNLKGRVLAEESGMRETSLRTTLGRIRQSLRDCINRKSQAVGEALANG